MSNMTGTCTPVNKFPSASTDVDYEEIYCICNKRQARRAKQVVGGCCVCSCCLFLTILQLIVILGGNFIVQPPVNWGWAEGLSDCPKYWCKLGDGPMLTPENITRYLRWGPCEPKLGFKTDDELAKCLGTCPSLPLLHGMEQFNKKNRDFQLVEYNSRPAADGEEEVVKLRGWWLKATGDNNPRIIIQHGIGSSANGRNEQYLAYMLRSMGFDVLINNARDHGHSDSSGQSTHTTWAYIYMYDILGAWDFAVKDPDGVLGGGRQPSKVGLLGHSMGAMNTASAFAYEKDVPAAWLDSAPFSGKSVVATQLDMMTFGLLGWLAGSAWWGAHLWAAVDIDRYMPEKVVPKCNKPRRPLAILASLADTFSPVSETDHLIHLFSTKPECYQVDELLLTPGTCSGNDHGVESFVYSELYQKELCRFWTSAFDLEPSRCKHLPHLGGARDEIVL